MRTRILLVLLLSLFLFACHSRRSSSRKYWSAQSLSCSTQSVELSDETGNTWTAECGGKRVKCVAGVGSDANTKCTPDPVAK
jgi:hypothetical protein